jgi:hypothetical protein
MEAGRGRVGRGASQYDDTYVAVRETYTYSKYRLWQGYLRERGKEREAGRKYLTLGTKISKISDFRY